MSLHSAPSHSVQVSDPKEAKEALEAAETLGLELRNVKVRGWWKYDEDFTIADHAECEIENLGHKWFYLDVDGTVAKCKPRHCPSQYSGDDGTLLMNFD